MPLPGKEKGLAGGAGGGNERPCSLAWTASEICAGCLPRRTTWNSKNAKRSNTAAPEGGHFFRAQSRKKPRQLSLSLLFSCATFWVAGEARARSNDKTPVTKADLEAAFDKLSQRMEVMGTRLEQKTDAMGSELGRKLSLLDKKVSLLGKQLRDEIDSKANLLNEGIGEVLGRLFEIDDRLNTTLKQHDERIRVLETHVRIAS